MNSGHFFCLIAVVSWGVAVIPIKHARKDPVAGLAIGLISGLFFVALFWLLSGAVWPPLTRSDWLFLVAGGITRFPMATYFYYEGIQRAGILIATPLGRLKPVFVCVIVVTLGWETPTPGAYAGAALAFLGAFLLYPRKLPVALDKVPIEPTDQRRSGIAFAVLASLSWALGDIFLNEVSGADEGLSSAVRTFFAIASGVIAYLILLTVGRKVGTVINLSAKSKCWYALHGILSFGIGTLAMVAALDTLPVTTVSVLTSSWPLISVTIGYLVYSERINRLQAIGLMITLGAATMVLIW